MNCKIFLCRASDFLNDHLSLQREAYVCAELEIKRNSTGEYMGIRSHLLCPIEEKRENVLY